MSAQISKRVQKNIWRGMEVTVPSQQRGLSHEVFVRLVNPDDSSDGYEIVYFDGYQNQVQEFETIEALCSEMRKYTAIRNWKLSSLES